MKTQTDIEDLSQKNFVDLDIFKERLNFESSSFSSRKSMKRKL